MFGKGSAKKVELAPHSRILNPGFKKTEQKQTPKSGTSHKGQTAPVLHDVDTGCKSAPVPYSALNTHPPDLRGIYAAKARKLSSRGLQGCGGHYKILVKNDAHI